MHTNLTHQLCTQPFTKWQYMKFKTKCTWRDHRERPLSLYPYQPSPLHLWESSLSPPLRPSSTPLSVIHVSFNFVTVLCFALLNLHTFIDQLEQQMLLGIIFHFILEGGCEGHFFFGYWFFIIPLIQCCCVWLWNQIFDRGLFMENWSMKRKTMCLGPTTLEKITR